MRKWYVVLMAGLIIFSIFGSNAAIAQEDCDQEGEDCLACKNNNFYYVLLAGLIVFTFFFYIRNRNKIG